MTNQEAAEAVVALGRLVRIAGGYSGGERRVRKFLFAWWNAAELGGFDFTDLWSLDPPIVQDVLRVITLIAHAPQGTYADKFGYGDAMEHLILTFARAAEPEDEEFQKNERRVAALTKDEEPGR